MRARCRCEELSLGSVSVIVSYLTEQRAPSSQRHNPSPHHNLSHTNAQRDRSRVREHTRRVTTYVSECVTHAKEHTTKTEGNKPISHAARRPSAHTHTETSGGRTHTSRHHRRRQPRLTSNTTAPLTHSLLHSHSMRRCRSLSPKSTKSAPSRYLDTQMVSLQ